jgi:dTDP-4-amino-4,6-dideoxy-D-galactose acyltransferase
LGSVLAVGLHEEAGDTEVHVESRTARMRLEDDNLAVGAPQKELCEIIDWDTRFFGYRVARVSVHRFTPPIIAAVLRWCACHDIRCIYFLADSDHAETVVLAEANGFHLVDVRVTLERTRDDVDMNGVSPLPGGLTVRCSKATDIPALQEIARNSYTLSRFYYDPHFSLEQCQAFYQSWVKESCEGWADTVLVAERDGEVAGFTTCHFTPSRLHGSLGLVGIGSRARGQGLAQVLVNHSLRRFAELGARTVEVVTQGRNVAAQRLYQRCGFLTHSVHLWYHKWFP